VHHNYVSFNSSTGDELFSATPAGAGGVSFCTGSDFYKFNYNWVCGNLSTGDGGGLGHLGFSYNGDIEHNMFLFNQSTNPTIVTNGGAMVIMGAPDVDPTCGATTDQDCVVTPAGSVGPSDGTGPGLTINANMSVGNQAESGSGGGIAFQQVNGSDAVAFPNSHCNAALSYTGNNNSRCRWNSVQATNNIIVNNVAGWDGGGVSFLDALAVNFINNTVMHNDSTASAGVLFDTIGAPLASTQGSNCMTTATTSCPQPGGLVSIQNSAVLAQNLAALPSSTPVVCPTGHGPQCASFSVPLLYNDVVYENRSFYIGVGALGTGTQNQQNIISLFNAFGSTQAPSQTATGQCPASSYWDIGVRGDTGPNNHASTFTLTPVYSFVGTGSYAGSNNNSGTNPAVAKPYCNGSRVPPELPGAVGLGWQVPAGISDATVPNPIFNLTAVATVDEGNNWVNISWGPLALMGPTGQGTGSTPDTFLGNYIPTSGSPTRNYIPASANGANGAYTLAPSTDFFGNNRKNGFVDAGAVEFTGAGGGGGGTATVSISPNPLTITVATPFGNAGSGNGVVTLTNTSTVASGSTATITSVAVNSGAGSGILSWFFVKVGDNCTGVTLQPQQSCTVTVNFTNVFSAVGVDRPGTIVFTDNATGSPQTGNLVGHANP